MMLDNPFTYITDNIQKNQILDMVALHENVKPFSNFLRKAKARIHFTVLLHYTIYFPYLGKIMDIILPRRQDYLCQ